jgi:hypothetical protein
MEALTIMEQDPSTHTHHAHSHSRYGKSSPLLPNPGPEDPLGKARAAVVPFRFGMVVTINIAPHVILPWRWGKAW